MRANLDGLCAQRTASLGLATAVLALAATTFCSHARLLRGPARPTAAQAPLLSVPATRLLSFGNPAWMADLYYLRAVGNFGDRAEHAAHYPRLAGLLRQSSELDRKFAGPYLLAGTSLLLSGNDNAAGMALLRRGCQERPDVWQLLFYRGFYAYYYLQDYDEAAESLVQAATLPHAPAFIGPLATRMAAHSSEPEAGLRLVDDLLAMTDDAGVRAAMHARRPLLLLEHRLRRLQKAVQHFCSARARPPTSLAELVAFATGEEAAGTPAAFEPFARCQQDPLGGTFVLTATGEVRTTHEQLRLHPHLQDRPREEPK